MDDIENLIFISDDDYADLQAEEEAGGQVVVGELPLRQGTDGSSFTPQPCSCRPHLPWQGRGDKLIGVVDMGR